MKKIVAIAILLAFIPNISAQEAPKKSNTILLTTSYTSAEEAITDAAHVLLDNNIQPDKLDKDLTYLISSVFPYKNANIRINIRAVKRDGKVEIVCRAESADGNTYKDPITPLGPVWTQVYRPALKLGIAYDAWEALLNMTLKIPHSSVRYEKR